MLLLTRRNLLTAATVLTPGMALASNASTVIDADWGGATDLKGWTEDVVAKSALWWPIITGSLSSPDYEAPDRVRLIVKPADGVASTEGAVITVNAAYVRAHPADIGLVAHELVHVVQAYPDRATPGWLTEGIADYLRYYVIAPSDPKRAFDLAKADYTRGYQPAAALLDYAERKVGGGVVMKINAQMRAGYDGEAAFASATSRKAADLWKDYLASRT